MGASDEDVNVQKFGRDIEQAMNLAPDIAAVGVSGDRTVQAAISFDENEVTNMLLKIVDVRRRWTEAEASTGIRLTCQAKSVF